MKPNLALFDFDGTITNKDTMFQFVLFAKGKAAYYKIMFLLLPWLVMLKLGLASAQSVKERLLRKTIGGLHVEAVDRLCRDFCSKCLPRLLREDALRELDAHLQRGDRVYIVSASPESWIAPWAETRGVDVISTRLKLIEGIVTGEIDGANCNGPEKVVRVKQLINPAEFDRIYAYGDSKGDRELLAFADYPFYRKFH